MGVGPAKDGPMSGESNKKENCIKSGLNTVKLVIVCERSREGAYLQLYNNP